MGKTGDVAQQVQAWNQRRLALMKSEERYA